MTWAFVGRWWEAPPWPLARNAKQRCHCLSERSGGRMRRCVSPATRSSLLLLLLLPPFLPHPIHTYTQRYERTHTHTHGFPMFLRTCSQASQGFTRAHAARRNSAEGCPTATLSHSPDLAGHAETEGVRRAVTLRAHVQK